MGSFGVSCGMSGITMEYDPAALFLLIPNYYEAKDGKFTFNQANLVSNEGAQTLFEPYTLLIFGNDYMLKHLNPKTIGVLNKRIKQKQDDE